MKSALSLLALTAALGLSVAGALTAAPITGPGPASPQAADPVPSTTTPLQLADNDHDDGWFFARKGARHDRHAHDDDEEDEDDDDYSARGCAAGQPACALNLNPAPAGTATPPANGLFAPGAKPAVQVN